jgi:hypothetical protein
MYHGFTTKIGRLCHGVMLLVGGIASVRTYARVRTHAPTHLRQCCPHRSTTRGDSLHLLGGTPIAVASDYIKWVLLQYVQHQIYFCNIQMKHLQYTSETAETLATYV